MILIPPYCHKDTPSSEKKVFNALKHDNNLITKNWIVYHSLNYPVSISKTKRSSFLYFGESDFLILAENIGIINIEVKGGSITCLDGIWQLKSRYETKNLSKSPIKQAHDTKYNIQEYIRKKFNRVYPQEYLVIFPDCSLTNIVDNIEYSENNIIDADQFYNNFSQRISNLVKDLKPGGNIVNLENNEINKLKKTIRPDFETYIKTSTILKDSEDEISQYTKDQLKVLERIEHEPRLLVTGSQGTGKTVMAEEIIKRFANTGKNILFINSGRLANLLTKFKYKDDYKNIDQDKEIHFLNKSNNYFTVNELNQNKFFDLNEHKNIIVNQSMFIDYCKHPKVVICNQFNPFSENLTFIKGFKNTKLSKYISAYRNNGSIFSYLFWRVILEARLVDTFLDPDGEKASIRYILNQIFENIKENKGTSLFFSHILVPHIPYGFNERCEYEGDKTINYNRTTLAQKRIQHNLEKLCWVKYLDEFFLKLKKIDEFDDLEIIILSDHDSRIDTSNNIKNNVIFLHKEKNSEISTIKYKEISINSLLYNLSLN